MNQNNFNYSKKPEYALHEGMINEVIHLYGIPVKFLKTAKINLDDHVFGDYSHMKTDSKEIYDMYVLPENPEGLDIANYNFTEFGFNLFENSAVFVSPADIKTTGLEPQNVVGHLLVFPNNKVLEIVNLDWMPVGVNNLFAFADEKSVFKLSLKAHEFKLTEEIEDDHLINDYTPEITQFTRDIDTEFSKELPADATVEKPEMTDYDKLDHYLDEVIKVQSEQMQDAEIVASTKPGVQAQEYKPIQERPKQNPIINSDESNTWNDF